MKKHLPKKQKTYSGDEVKRYVGVIAEEFRGHVKTVGEQYAALAEMVGKTMENVEILKGDMDIVKSGFKQKLDYNEFSALQRRVRILETKIK